MSVLSGKIMSTRICQICVFVFAYADCWFSHEAAHLSANYWHFNIFKQDKLPTLAIFTRNFYQFVISLFMSCLNFSPS